MAYTNAINNVPSSIVSTFPRDWTFKDCSSQLNTHRDGRRQEVRYFGPETFGYLRGHPELAPLFHVLGAGDVDVDRSSITDTTKVCISGTAFRDVSIRYGCLNSTNPRVESCYPVHLLFSLFMNDEPVMGNIHAFTREEPIGTMEPGTIYSRTGQQGGFTRKHLYKLMRYVATTSADPLVGVFGNKKQLEFHLQADARYLQNRIHAQCVKLTHYALCGGVPIHMELSLDNSRITNHKQCNAREYMENSMATFLWSHDPTRARGCLNYVTDCIKKTEKAGKSPCVKPVYVAMGKHSLKLFDEHFGSAGYKMKPTRENAVLMYSKSLFQPDEKDIVMRQDRAYISDTPKALTSKEILAIDWDPHTNIVALNDKYTTESGHHVFNTSSNPENFKSILIGAVQVGVLKKGSEHASQDAHSNVDLCTTEYYSPSEDKKLTVNEWQCNAMYSHKRQFNMKDNRDLVVHRDVSAHSILNEYKSEGGFLGAISAIKPDNSRSHPLFFVFNNPKARPFLVRRPGQDGGRDGNEGLHYKLNRVVGGSNNAQHPPEMVHAITRSYFKEHAIDASEDADTSELFDTLIANHGGIDTVGMSEVASTWQVLVEVMEKYGDAGGVGGSMTLLRARMRTLYEKYNFGWALLNGQLFWAVHELYQKYMVDILEGSQQAGEDPFRRDYRRFNMLALSIKNIKDRLMHADENAVTDRLRNVEHGYSHATPLAQYHHFYDVARRVKNEDYGGVHFPHHYKWKPLKNHRDLILFVEMIVLPVFCNHVYMAVDTAHVRPGVPVMKPTACPVHHVGAPTCSYTHGEALRSTAITDMWKSLYIGTAVGSVGNNETAKRLPYISQICTPYYAADAAASRSGKSSSRTAKTKPWSYMVFYSQGSKCASEDPAALPKCPVPSPPASSGSSSGSASGTSPVESVNYTLYNVTSTVPGVNNSATPPGYDREARPRTMQEYAAHPLAAHHVVYPLDPNSFHLSTHYDTKVHYLRSVGSMKGSGFSKLEKIYAHFMCLYLNTELTWSTPRNFKFWFGYDCYTVGMGSFEMAFGIRNQSVMRYVGATTFNVESGESVVSKSPSIAMGMVPMDSDPCVYTTIASNVKTEFITNNVYTNKEAESGSMQQDRHQFGETLSKTRFDSREHSIRNCLGRLMPVPTCAYKPDRSESFNDSYVHILGRAGPYFDGSAEAKTTQQRTHNQPKAYRTEDLRMEDVTSVDGVYITNSYAFYTGCAALFYGPKARLENYIWNPKYIGSQESLHQSLKNTLKGSETVNQVHQSPDKVWQHILQGHYVINHTCALKLDFSTSLVGYGSNRVSALPGAGGKLRVGVAGSRVIDPDTAKLVNSFEGSMVPAKHTFKEKHNYVHGTTSIASTRPVIE